MQAKNCPPKKENSLPSTFRDDHLRAELGELCPQLLALQGHLGIVLHPVILETRLRTRGVRERRTEVVARRRRVEHPGREEARVARREARGREARDSAGQRKGSRGGHAPGGRGKAEVRGRARGRHGEERRGA